MKQEFSSYQRQKKESVLEFLGGCILIFIFLILGDHIIDILIKSSIGFVFILDSIVSLHGARKSTLILDYDGIKLVMPLMKLNASWQNISVVEMRVGFRRGFAIHSPDMIIKKTHLGNLLIPSNMEEDMIEKGVPISKYLGNDLEKILEVLSAYPEFKNCP